jgi:hypothetical protein
MSFSEAERVLVRTYCGRPAQPQRDRFATSDYGDIEQSMDALEGNADREAAIRAALARIAVIEGELGGAQGFATMAKAEEVTLDPDRYNHLRGNGLRECRLLASLLACKVKGNPFGGGMLGGGPLRAG